MNHPVPLNRATCKGGPLRWFGFGMSNHFFSHDYGMGDMCWHAGCDEMWYDHQD